jgi:hypothetical protein
MAAVANFRLPGVYFLPAPRAAAIDLPPLDVAGLVGFATRGPLDIPVPIEDLSTFDAIFGPAFAVARDADGKPLYAYLRDAVASFFSCGGRRCYVVRVAGRNAVPARFGVPGMIALDGSGNVGRAQIDASSAGAWGNALRLGTILTTTPLPQTAFTVAGATSLSWNTLGAPQAVQPGDVLRLVLDNARQWLFPVAAVTPPYLEDLPVATLTADSVWPVSTVLQASLLPTIRAVSNMTMAGPARLDVTATFFAVDTGIGLWLTGNDRLHVTRDDMLLLDFADGSQHMIDVADAQAQLSLGSLPAQGVEVTATEMLCLRNAPGSKAALPGVPAPLAQVERLQLTLRIKYGDASTRDIDWLGFNGSHPRFWGDIAVAESGSLAGGPATSSGVSQQQQSQTLAPDAATGLYAQLFGEQRVDIDWTDPRLMTVLPTLLAPAAATTPVDPSGETAPLTYLPVGMPLIGSDADLVGPDANTANDDLPSFGAQPFLDPNLVNGSAVPAGGGATPSTLWSAATDLYFLQDIRLKGIHSLMFIDEVALVSVPDAIHRGWEPGTVEPVQAPPPPVATAPPPAVFADCLTPPVVFAVDPTGGPIAQTTAERQTAVTIKGSGFAAPVNVTFGGRPAAAVRVVDGATITCLAPQATTPGPVAVTVSSAAGMTRLAAAFFYWQDSTQPLLPLANPVEGFGNNSLPSLPSAGFNSGWLQTIHTSLIGLCEARADTVAILSLPLHFERQDCVGWLQNLRQNLGLPRHGVAFADARDIADLSYAAVYHPWLLVPDPNAPSGVLRPVPPEGAICGAVAAREIAREVWVAPANVPLPGVLDLQPGFSNDDWATLFALGFNLVRQEPKDFRVMSAHTLADDQSLLQLSVRRLLIQLRKAALQRGQDYVFDKNDEVFRQQVRGGLEDLLRFMFDGGAFSGATQPSSYRIVVDDSINTPNDTDQGRMIAQILIAPSQPMEFLTVLLTRTGEGQLHTAEG